jgi:hypothetical protein
MIIIYIIIISFGGYVLITIIEKIIKRNKNRGSNLTQSYPINIPKQNGFTIETTLAGVNHENRELQIKQRIKSGELKQGTPLVLLPDPENSYDNTATKVCTLDGIMLGFLPNRDWNDEIFHDLMKDKKWGASVKEIIKPSERFKNYNLLIELWKNDN